MLDEQQVADTVRFLFASHRLELERHDRVYGYLKGRRGIPDVPDGAGDELVDLARLSVKNMMPLVRDAFTTPLSVVGFRSPKDSRDTPSPAWELWQKQKLDARQAEAHRAAVTYGTAYAFIKPETIRFRSPRQAFALYADPQVDDWPVYALDTWIDYSGKKPLRRGELYDETHIYPVTMGSVSVTQIEAEKIITGIRRFTVVTEDPPVEHGMDYTPVARFINARDAEDPEMGELEPLIVKQKALNATNFDRLCVLRYGAFPQKWVIGWAPASKDELIEASVQRLMSFDDDKVTAGAFPQAQIDPYNSTIREMQADIALTAGAATTALTGDMTNVSADTVAQINAMYRQKKADKRTSFGETWEQILRTFASMNDVVVPDDAETIWAVDDDRSYAQVVDGISKLEAAGVPITELLEDIPGWTQQRIDSAVAALRRAAGTTALSQILDRVSAGGSPPAA